MNRAITFLLCGAVILCAAVDVLALEAGKIQLAVAAPDPVVAGGDVTFQVIVVNAGTTRWSAGDYYVEAEVYDAQKNYIAKPSRIKGTVNVDPQKTNLFYIPFSVPNGFVGVYHYRVFIYFKEQRVVESEYYTFNVTPLPAMKPKPADFRIGGNAVLSYKQTSKYEGKDYVGNLNLNLVGQIMERAMLFNMYTFHTPKSTTTSEGMDHEIYTILFNYYGDNWNFGAGDVLPIFSPLSLYGTGMRGAQYEYKGDRFSYGLVGARTVKALEGNTTSNGTYERWIIGGRMGYDVVAGVNVGADYVSSFDRQESLTTPGPSLTPASNGVVGGTVRWDITEQTVLDVEYQSSSYVPDVKNSSTTITDYAYRAEIKYNPENFLIKTMYQETRPDFYSFGSPGAARDRKTIDVYTNKRFFNRLSVNAGLNSFSDNLDKDPDKVTTTQNIYSAGANYSSPGRWPSPFLAYSLNTAVGDPKTAQDNYTNSISFGLTGKVSAVNIVLSLQQSAFRDNNKIADDLDSDIVNFIANSSFGSRLSMNVGLTQTKTSNIVTETVNDTPSYSLSVNVGVLPEKLTAQLWGTMITRKNDAVNVSDQIDQQERSGNAELTWLVVDGFTWTLGTSYLDVQDEITADNTYVEHGVNTRLSYSF
ncbi:MAG: hypothetical protein JW803_08640 [Endomicrobiales bacterium]|nr:hypothetical protein [Endomicrobiales bacterium]